MASACSESGSGPQFIVISTICLAAASAFSNTYARRISVSARDKKRFLTKIYLFCFVASVPFCASHRGGFEVVCLVRRRPRVRQQVYVRIRSTYVRLPSVRLRAAPACAPCMMVFRQLIIRLRQRSSRSEAERAPRAQSDSRRHSRVDKSLEEGQDGALRCCCECSGWSDAEAEAEGEAEAEAEAAFVRRPAQPAHLARSQPSLRDVQRSHGRGRCQRFGTSPPFVRRGA